MQQTGHATASRGELVGFKRHFREPADNAAVLGASQAGTQDLALDMHCLAGGYAGLCSVEDGAVNLCGVMPRQRSGGATVESRPPYALGPRIIRGSCD